MVNHVSNLSGRRDVELLEEVVHDEDGDDDGDEDGVGEADDEDRSDDVVQLDEQQPEVKTRRRNYDIVQEYSEYSTVAGLLYVFMRDQVYILKCQTFQEARSWCHFNHFFALY